MKNNCDVSGSFPKCTGGTGDCSEHVGPDDDWCRGIATGMGGPVCGNMQAIEDALAQSHKAAMSDVVAKHLAMIKEQFGKEVHDTYLDILTICKKK